MSIIVLKGLLGDDDEKSLVADIEGFRSLGIGSQILRFELEPDEIFEANLLGHSNLVLDQGPLTVAALGWSPPDRSLDFHLSMLSMHEDQIQFVTKGPSPEERLVIERQLERLNTAYLTVLLGEGLDHALVCTKILELRTHRPSEAAKNGLNESMPNGDGENDLRRFIDDSVNLLTAEEFNLRRIDNGILPINLCWPWGQGERQNIANRALQLGVPWMLRANSLATRGLARLSGFQAERIPLFANLDFRDLMQILEGSAHEVTIIDLGANPKDEDEIEKRTSRLNSFSELVIEPLLEWQYDTKSSLTFVATSRTGKGLIAHLVKHNERDIFPFDERSVNEKRVPQMNLLKILEIGN